MKTAHQDNKLKSISSPAGNVRSTSDELGDLREAIDGVAAAVSAYGRKNPTTVAVALFFVGFYVGWKVKPW